MPTYKEIHDVWASQELRQRLMVAMLTAANDVVNEDAGTENHANRVAWAKKVVGDPGLEAMKMSSLVLMNPTVQTGEYTDSDLQFVVNGLVNTYANAGL